MTSHSCTQCGHPFVATDLARDETEDMEADRTAAGLRGVRFLYYACPACEMADIVVDILPLRGEQPERFQRRRSEMEAVVRKLHADRPDGAADVVVRVVNHPSRTGVGV
jgi:hypothetical protein